MDRHLAAASQNANPSDVRNALSTQAIIQLAGHEQTVLTVPGRCESLRPVKPRVKRNGPRAIGAQVQNHHLIRRADKHFPSESNAATTEFQMCDRIVEIQFAAISLDP